MKVPGFLVKQFYVSGSLRNTASGFSLQARNPMGDGVLVGVGRVAVNGREIPLDRITAQRVADGQTFRASEVNSRNPIQVRQGDRVTLNVSGLKLAPGKHQLEVELFEGSLGTLRLSVADRLTDS